MIRVVTYETFDFLDKDHISFLDRAKVLGDYFIVGVINGDYDCRRGKLNVGNNVWERVETVKATGIAVKVIIEDYIGQRIDDDQKNHVDNFAIGTDWSGKFDCLGEFCNAVSLSRTEGCRSTIQRDKLQEIEDWNCSAIGKGSAVCSDIWSRWDIECQNRPHCRQ